jgi:hypothetical protein
MKNLFYCGVALAVIVFVYSLCTDKVGEVSLKKDGFEIEIIKNLTFGQAQQTLRDSIIKLQRKISEFDDVLEENSAQKLEILELKHELDVRKVLAEDLLKRLNNAGPDNISSSLKSDLNSYLSFDKPQQPMPVVVSNRTPIDEPTISLAEHNKLIDQERNKTTRERIKNRELQTKLDAALADGLSKDQKIANLDALLAQLTGELAANKIAIKEAENYKANTDKEIENKNKVLADLKTEKQSLEEARKKIENAYDKMQDIAISKPKFEVEAKSKIRFLVKSSVVKLKKKEIEKFILSFQGLPTKENLQPDKKPITLYIAFRDKSGINKALTFQKKTIHGEEMGFNRTFSVTNLPQNVTIEFPKPEFDGPYSIFIFTDKSITPLWESPIIETN